jgi:HSP20 family protein
MAKTKEARNESTDVKRDQQNESRKGDQRSQAMQPRRGNEMQRPSSPFGFMRRFNEEMDRLFQDFGFGRGFPESSLGREMGMFGGGGPSMWSPQVEVFEREGELCVRADLPGMTKDDIEVDLADNALVIRGDRRSEREEEEEGYYHTERSYGSFYRTIPLPEGIDAENAEATFRNGVLEITMPAPERAGRRRLEVREGEEERPRSQTKAAGQR